MARPQSPKNMSKAELKAAIATAKGDIKTNFAEVKSAEKMLKMATGEHAAAVKAANKVLGDAQKAAAVAVKAADKALAATTKAVESSIAKANANGAKAEARLAELTAVSAPAAAPATVTPIKAARKTKAKPELQAA